MSDQLKQYRNLILHLAAVYNYHDKMSQNLLNSYAKMLSRYKIEDCLKGAEGYLLDLENRFFPQPIHSIIKYAFPQLNESEKATLIANDIWAGISRFGSYNEDRAKEKLGKDVWLVVERYGGWKKICEDSNFQNGGVMKAQLRELSKVVMKIQKNKDLNKITFIHEIDKINESQDFINNDCKEIS